ncbi:DDE-type integrase/transposase/recombinase [Sphingobacterium zhuxiongii]|uniref:DDE-type integrase/transposase/recombinase n=1 Tax=Sphingobacterium zhuxiongii TaxID=2662364 RepID=UPI001E5EC88F|nr:DDE-type integrase/transposase/recombinase [Sphingobacterium sp. dk4302]
MKYYRPNQVWVSDLTYIGKREKPCYLSLITDVYSKKIVGFEISSTMCTSHVCKSIENGSKTKKNKGIINPSFRQRYPILFRRVSILSKQIQD